LAIIVKKEKEKKEKKKKKRLNPAAQMTVKPNKIQLIILSAANNLSIPKRKGRKILNIKVNEKVT